MLRDDLAKFRGVSLTHILFPTPGPILWIPTVTHIWLELFALITVQFSPCLGVSLQFP